MDRSLKSARTVKIGKRFSDKRISLSLSLEEASKILFINVDYLNAIEKGDYSIFPSESFARAYFKKYAQYLKINANVSLKSSSVLLSFFIISIKNSFSSSLPF